MYGFPNVGLEYLHNGCKPSIIHRDGKPTKILLNENYQAKIVDFGLSKIFATDDANATHLSTRVVGTPGYLDPEWVFILRILSFIKSVIPIMHRIVVKSKMKMDTNLVW